MALDEGDCLCSSVRCLPVRWRLPRGGCGLYVARATYALALLVLMGTGWLVLTGTQLVRDVGDLARFGAVMFQILAPLQLALAAFFSALLAASEVAHEKDRHTLVLLLLTSLSNSELVLGKLLASLLGVLVMLAAAPAGVHARRRCWAACPMGRSPGRWPSRWPPCWSAAASARLLALWREKTFQALAMTVLVLVLWLAVGEIVAAGVLGETIARPALPGAGRRAQSLAGHSRGDPPVRPRPAGAGPAGHAGPPVSAAGRGAAALLLNGVAVGDGARVESVAAKPSGRQRGESATGETRRARTGDRKRAREQARPGSVLPLPLSPSPSLSPSCHRRVWDNPVIWREIRTWAYGRKILVVRLAYWCSSRLAAGGLVADRSPAASGRATPRRRWLLVPAGAAEPGAGQRPGRHVVDQRARRPGAGPAAGDRPDAEGDRLRQAGRRVLQHQGNGAAADAAVRRAFGWPDR